MPKNMSKIINVIIGVLIIIAVIYLWYNTTISAILAIIVFLLGFFKREVMKILA